MDEQAAALASLDEILGRPAVPAVHQAPLLWTLAMPDDNPIGMMAMLHRHALELPESCRSQTLLLAVWGRTHRMQSSYHFTQA